MSSEVAKALPPSILALFAPRPPITFFKPVKKGKARPYTGVSSILDEFESKEEAAAATASWKPYETLQERRAKVKEARAARLAAYHEDMRARYDPSNDDRLSGDPFRTLFVAHLVSTRTMHAPIKHRRATPFLKDGFP